MTYVPGQFFPYIVLSPCHKQPISKMAETLDRIQIWRDGSLGISDDLINFWEESIKNKMADGGHFEKIVTRRAFGSDIL